MTKFRKTITAGLVAATLGVGVAGTSTPAAAGGYYPYWGWGAGAAVAGLALGAAAAAAATLRLSILLSHPPAGRRPLGEHHPLSPRARLQLRSLGPTLQQAILPVIGCVYGRSPKILGGLLYRLAHSPAALNQPNLSISRVT
jgi:hypothetical protein